MAFAPTLVPAKAGIGNDRFAFFATTGSKSRLYCAQVTRSAIARLKNFLELPRAGQDDYVINAAALDYMRDRKLPKATIALLTADAERRFAGRGAFMAHPRLREDKPGKARPHRP